MKTSSGPEFTNRFNGFRAAQINGILAPGYSSAQAARPWKRCLPKPCRRKWADYSGMSFQEHVASHGVPASAIFGLSLLFVFLILSAQYESWSLPFSVLLTTPIAVFGAFTALWLRAFENNVYAQIGLVMLIGLSAKNAILIVEFAKAEYEGGKSSYRCGACRCTTAAPSDLDDGVCVHPRGSAPCDRVRCRCSGTADHGHGSHRRYASCVSHRDISDPGLFLRRTACFAPARGGTSAGTAAASGDEVGTDMYQQAYGAPRALKPQVKARSYSYHEGHEVRIASLSNISSLSYLRVPRVLRGEIVFIAAMAMLVCLSGCMVGPDYNRPSAAIPDQFRAAMTSDGQSIADLKWFEVFSDEQLQELIRTALVQNYDLRDAVARVDQARANLGITQADQYPNFGAGGGFTSIELSREGHLAFPAETAGETLERFSSVFLPTRSTSGAGCAGRRSRRAPSCWPPIGTEKP